MPTLDELRRRYDAEKPSPRRSAIPAVLIHDHAPIWLVPKDIITKHMHAPANPGRQSVRGQLRWAISTAIVETLGEYLEVGKKCPRDDEINTLIKSIGGSLVNGANWPLGWRPTRAYQRTGRIDRIPSLKQNEFEICFDFEDEYGVEDSLVVTVDIS